MRCRDRTKTNAAAMASRMARNDAAKSSSMNRAWLRARTGRVAVINAGIDGDVGAVVFERGVAG